MCPEIYSGVENVLEFQTDLVVNPISTPIFLSGNETVHNKSTFQDCCKTSRKLAMAYRKCTSPIVECLEPLPVLEVDDKYMKRMLCLFCGKQLADSGRKPN